MFLIGISMVLSSFTTDLSESHPTWHGTIHSAAFYTFVLAQRVTYFSMWRRFRKDLRWRGYGRYSLLNGILTLPPAAAALALGTAFQLLRLLYLAGTLTAGLVGAGGDTPLGGFASKG
jgi:hypothetical protein